MSAVATHRSRQMHISEGILSIPVLTAGVFATGGGTVVGLRRLDYDRLPKAGILAAAFFVASLIHVPVGVASIHLVLNGLCGLILGWTAFPVILVAMILQAVFFQFGGITTLGINTAILAFPAVLVHLLFKPFLKRKSGLSSLIAFLAGFSAILLSSLATAASLALSGSEFFEIAGIVAVANLPVMVVEGAITLFCIDFLRRVYPVLLFGKTDGSGDWQA